MNFSQSFCHLLLIKDTVKLEKVFQFNVNNLWNVRDGLFIFRGWHDLRNLKSQFIFQYLCG
jgi:hypothetical protein